MLASVNHLPLYKDFQTVGREAYCVLTGTSSAFLFGGFPLLREATPEQREHYEISGGGISLHWPEIDEDLSVANLMAGVDRQAAQVAQSESDQVSRQTRTPTS